MNPKKSKVLISDVSTEMCQSEELVNAVISFYWREVRKNLSSVAHSRIHLANLGDFVIKHWKVQDKIENLEKWEETNKQKGLQQITSRFKVAETLYDLKNLTKIIDEEKQRKEFIKLHKTKKDVKSRKKHNKNMEEQRSDS